AEASTWPSHNENPLIHRPYHRNPPAHRSKWILWAGNVPSDATHDELWRFFNQSADAESKPSPSAGIQSISVISRFNCAFVSFESKHQLIDAIERFNGQPLRPNDAHSPRLVCRARKMDDDLRVGVGQERNNGMDIWCVMEREGKAEESDDASKTSTWPDRLSTPWSDHMASMRSLVDIMDDGDHRERNDADSSSIRSYASTNSGLLTRSFPRRYFVLKSLTQFELDLSVKSGLWSTQKHNEEILDQASRTSQEVYLIFILDKSEEFYGYAKLSGPVHHGEQGVSWAART
ncbi:YT521-B-like domain-containing protein, partial [Lyophyllum atratum]